VEDSEVIDSFVNGDTKRAFGTSLHVESDVLMLDGWWHCSLRMSDEAFIIRNEPPPRDTTVLEDVAAALTAKGLSNVASDLPGITVLTMAKASLGYVSWTVWAENLEAGQAAVAAAVTEESFFEPTAYYDPTAEKDYSAELAGARRLAGLPPSVVLTVGLDGRTVGLLERTLTDCRVVNRAFGEIEPDACGSLVPTAVVIDATEQRGLEFVMQLRAAACGRFLPVVAITADGMTPLGADTAVSSGQDPEDLVSPIRAVLP
jgi:hypothetical protein